MFTCFLSSCAKWTLISVKLCAKPVSKVSNTSNNLKRSFSTGYLPIDNVQNLKKNVLLYTFEKTKTFRLVTIFGIAQLGIWLYYANTMFYSLRDIKNSTSETEVKSTFWRRINLGDIKYRIIAVIACLSVGVGTAVISVMLPTRIVKSLTLCKGGKTAIFTTYGPFGKTKQFKAPIHKLSCLVSRNEAKSYVTIKVKDKWMYYLIDSNGQFIQPLLFDFTVGTRTSRRL
ncbi:transmembrane protein 223-like [Uloborus diversus]|uniref:transmembrane protein 223-like n=1 Tax=Uloborus diversus TaxID=327109 RepID=UPI0024097A68|nr:transmembrane protein 223-like [Uloborus diversus]